MAVQEVSIFKDNLFGSRVFIDGIELKNVKSLDLHLDNQSVPDLKVDLYALPQAEFTAQVHIDYTSRSLQEAVRIFCDTIEREEILRDGVIASIVSALKEYNLPFMPEEELAAHILNRIVGDE